MISIIKNNAVVTEEKFSVATVSQAIGRSEGSISAYFSNKGESTKGGITIRQVVEVLESPVRGQIIDWKGVDKIRKQLVHYGYEVVETCLENEGGCNVHHE